MNGFGGQRDKKCLFWGVAHAEPACVPLSSQAVFSPVNLARPSKEGRAALS